MIKILESSTLALCLCLCLCLPGHAKEQTLSERYSKEIADRIDSVSKTDMTYEQQIRAAVPPELINQVRNDLIKLIKPLDKPLHVKVCLFDILGKAGPLYSIAQDVVLEAKRWNLHVDLMVFTNETVAAESFKTGQCEGVALTTLRARQFNPYMGSFDAVGALPSYAHVVTGLKVLLGSDKLYAKSINGPYQIIGMAPVGAAYVMVNDRQINSIEKAAGKKVAVMDWDKSQAKMIQQLGAQAVPSDITNFSNKFNNGVVDIIAAPALAFEPLELYKGLGTKGGIFDMPLINVTGSALLNRTRIEKEVPDLDERLMKLRRYGLQFLDLAVQVIERVERQVPQRYWMQVSEKDQITYNQMMRQARLQLMQDGTYDPDMMKLLKRVRCHHNPKDAECSQPGDY